MPEGDTLRRLADRIDRTFAGRTVERAELRDPRLAGVELCGRTVAGADAYGKHLFVRFDDGRSLHAHLGMAGAVEVGRPSREPEWKRRVELWMTDGRLTAVDVPELAMIATGDERLITSRLGPDLCAVSGPPDVALIASSMAASPHDAIAGALLDQSHAAGFGNIYATELPFICGVSPYQRVGTLDGLDGLVALGVALIRVNAARGPQNTTGRRLATSARWLHGASRGRCPVCGDPLGSDREPPWGRTIRWCPSCQPTVERGTVDLGRVGDLLALHPAMKEPDLYRRVQMRRSKDSQ